MVRLRKAEHHERMKNQPRTNLIPCSCLALILALAIMSPVQSPSAEPAEEQKMCVLASALTQMAAQPTDVKTPKTKENAVMMKRMAKPTPDLEKGPYETRKLISMRQSDRALFWPW